jgi:hypothetical protein
MLTDPFPLASDSLKLFTLPVDPGRHPRTALAPSTVTFRSFTRPSATE